MRIAKSGLRTPGAKRRSLVFLCPFLFFLAAAAAASNLIFSSVSTSPAAHRPTAVESVPAESAQPNNSFIALAVRAYGSNW